MPICRPCRQAAQGKGDLLACSVCGKRGVSVYRTDVPLAEQSVFFHKAAGFRCDGSGRPPVVSTFHDYCDGCPCQHKPRGSWNATQG